MLLFKELTSPAVKIQERSFIQKSESAKLALDEIIKKVNNIKIKKKAPTVYRK